MLTTVGQVLVSGKTKVEKQKTKNKGEKMSKESYARGFCKAAAAAGVDPVALAKFAYTQKDVDEYKSSVINAGKDAVPYLTEQEKTQPLPSVDDIRDAFRHAKGMNHSQYPFLMIPANQKWRERFEKSLAQERIMPKESPIIDGRDATAFRALANLVRGKAVKDIGDHGGYIGHREIPEDVFRGAWPAFTNMIEHGSSPVRPAQQQIVLKK